jgi:hypothetical protein
LNSYGFSIIRKYPVPGISAYSIFGKWSFIYVRFPVGDLSA